MENNPEESAKKIKENFEEAKKLAKELGKEFKDFNLKDTADDAAKVLEFIKFWNKELKEAVESYSSINSSVQKLLNLTNKSNIGLNIAKDSYDRIRSLAYQITEHQLKNNKLSKINIEDLQNKLKLEFRILEHNKFNLKLKQKILEKSLKGEKDEGKRKSKKEELDAINIALIHSQTEGEKMSSTLNHLQEQIKEVAVEAGIFEHKLGNVGNAFDGIVGTLEGLGLVDLSKTLGLTEAKDAMAEMAQFQTDHLQQALKVEKLNKRNISLAQIKNGFGGIELKLAQEKLDLMDAESIKIGANNGKLSVYSAGLQSMMKTLSSKALSIVYLVNELKNAIISSDIATGNLARSFSLSYDSALNVRRELGTVAAFSGDISLNTKNLSESMVAYGASLGSNARLNEEDLITMTKMVQQAGYKHDELIEIEKLSQINNVSLDNNLKSALGGAKAYAMQKGLLINEREILKGINSASASLKLSLGGSVSEIGKAVVQTKALGLTLEQAASMSDSLLQFESSIENELSAELLTGKDLNFEKARLLALNNDIAGAAEEIANQVGSSADFANMNAIQQEAIAKAAGLTKDALAQSLIDREAMVALNGIDGKTAKEKYETLRKTMTAEQAAAYIGDEALSTQLESQSVQERMNVALEKFKEIFVQVAEPILKIISPIADLAGSILPLIAIILQPIMWTFSKIADIISYAVNSAKDLVGYFKGSTKELGFWKGLLGAIVLVWGSIKAISWSLLAYQKVGLFLTGSLASLNKIIEVSQGKQTAAKVTQNALDVTQLSLGQRILAMLGLQNVFGKKNIASKTSAVVLDGTQLTLGQRILATLGLQNAAEVYKNTLKTSGSTLTAIIAGLEQTILGKLVLQGLALLGNIARMVVIKTLNIASVVAETVKAALISTQNKGFLGLIAKGAIFLIQQIATAVAMISGASAVSVGIAAAIALAAGAAAYAFFSSMKDGEIDYAKGPVVSGGFGSVQLDKNDTGYFDKNGIKAGTDLFKNIPTPEKDNTSAGTNLFKNIPPTEKDNASKIQPTPPFKKEDDVSGSQPKDPFKKETIVIQPPEPQQDQQQVLGLTKKLSELIEYQKESNRLISMGNEQNNRNSNYSPHFVNIS